MEQLQLLIVYEYLLDFIALLLILSQVMEIFSPALKVITVLKAQVFQLNALKDSIIQSSLPKVWMIVLNVQPDTNAQIQECKLLLLVTMVITAQKELMCLRPAHKAHMMMLEN